MLHILKNQLLVNIREKSGIFWTLIFPMILATFFHFAFEGFGEVGNMEGIKAAVVTAEAETGEEKEAQALFETYLEGFDAEILEILITEEEKAKQMLKDDQVQGIFYNGKEQTLAVGADSVTSSILQQILNGYVKNQYAMGNIVRDHPENLEAAIEAAGNYEEVTKQVSAGRKSLDIMQTYFFALLGMACMYGSFLGMYNTVRVQPNTSALGARVSTGCMKKWQSIVASLLSCWMLSMGEILILLFYMDVVLGEIDSRSHFGKILVICMAGCFCSSSLGMLIGTLGKWDPKMKNSFLIGISMVCSFLADLMLRGVKYVLELYAPFVNRVNPAALISDAFYSILIYEDGERYVRSVAGLVCMGVILLTITVLSMRRMRYGSI